MALHVLTFLRKGGPDISFFYHLSTPYFGHQYKSLYRAKVTSANLICCCICHIIAWVNSGMGLIIWSVANSSSPPNLVDLFTFTLFWISYSRISTEIHVSRMSHSLLKRPLASFCESQSPRLEEDLQVHKEDLQVELISPNLWCLWTSGGTSKHLKLLLDLHSGECKKWICCPKGTKVKVLYLMNLGNWTLLKSNKGHRDINTC